jgi:hypothetical protein
MNSKDIGFLICLLLAATPGLLVATLPAWATKENVTTIIKSHPCPVDQTYIPPTHSSKEPARQYICWVI